MRQTPILPGNCPAPLICRGGDAYFIDALEGVCVVDQIGQGCTAPAPRFRSGQEGT